MSSTFADPRVAMLAILFTLSTVVHAQKSGTEKTGDIVQILVPLTAYGSTFYLHDQEGRYQLYKSFLANLAVTYALKYSINKQRPRNNGAQSFPSGHTSAAFQGAAFIQKRYGWQTGWPAYVAASYVGWSRVASYKHDVIDVVAGAALGILSSYYFTTPYQGVTITPVVGNKTYGVNVSMKW